MARISGEAVEEAKRVLRQAYYAQVSGEVADLVRAYFDGEYDDEDGQRESISAAADNHITYTSDQYDTIYSSENSSDGSAMVADMGGGAESPEALLGRWAYFTFETDVMEALNNQFGIGAKLLTPAMEAGLGDEQRLIWLAANATKRYLWTHHAKGDDVLQHSLLVGTFNPNEAGETDLGVITLWTDDGEHVKVQRESTRHFFKDFGPAIQTLAGVVSDNPEDEGAWHVLYDAMLERSVLIGQEPQYEHGRPASRSGHATRGGTREKVGLIEFLEANWEDEQVLAQVLAMKVGQHEELSGGSTAEFPLTRVA